MAAEGYQSRAAAADFERCLQLGGTDLRDDELFPTLTALTGYYFVRADLRRTAQLFESLRAGLEEGRQWLRPALEAGFGVVAWLRGQFDAARSQLEKATAGRAAADQHEIDAVWFDPADPIATAHIHLALIGLVRGDLAGAEAELTQAARRTEQLGFPQGPFNLAYTRLVESWIRIEAGQLDQAAALAADLTDLGERHGFDHWRLTGAAQQVTVRALAALGADDLDPSGLWAHIATVTRFVDSWRRFGLNLYLTFFDSVVGRLLIAAGQPDEARRRLDTGWHWPTTPGCVSTTPNCCGCAPTPTPTPTVAEPTSPRPSPSPAAKARLCLNYVPRSTITTYAAKPPCRAGRRRQSPARRQHVAGPDAGPGDPLKHSPPN